MRPNFAHPQGIYLLGNDVVLHQLQTLFQRIQDYFAQNHCAPLPVCVIPSNDDLRATRRWVAQHGGLSLFEDSTSMQVWEDFAQSIWVAQPVVEKLSQRYSDTYGQVCSFRRFCAFDGDFETFIFCDARSQSTHGLDRLDEALIQLQTYAFVFDDWEHLKAKTTAVLDIAFVQQALNWSEAQVRNHLHGASVFGSHAGLIGEAERKALRHQLLEAGELRWLNPLAWWNDAALFSYITLWFERNSEHDSGRTPGFQADGPQANEQLKENMNRSGEMALRSLYNFARPPHPVEASTSPTAPTDLNNPANATTPLGSLEPLQTSTASFPPLDSPLLDSLTLEVDGDFLATEFFAMKR